MYASWAGVPTDRAVRYLAQLCKHTHQVNDLGPDHANRSGHGSDGAGVRLQHVEWSDAEGVIQFVEGRCTLRATSTALVLHAEADSPERLRRIQSAIALRLEGIGRRDRLAVVWEPAGAGPATGRDAGPGPGGEAVRRPALPRRTGVPRSERS
jgi:hypothetical protein